MVFSLLKVVRTRMVFVRIWCFTNHHTGMGTNIETILVLLSGKIAIEVLGSHTGMMMTVRVW